MSFLKSLFGGGDKKPATPKVDAHEEHEGYTIKAVLMQAGGEYQIAGTIEKEVDGELKIYKFIRADKFASKEDAIVATLGKGRQLIKEQGAGLFR
ncbi:HlyU family transcriptional regulator [Pelagibacterium xiamenense]|uniref:HlyU family transcriptional regulator n=1 Tax=Pelagibacterium xiamenense TaxID=2901140 RepID=UPI001E3781DA|nr:HlyU family transcriptional regulator [Pelagibacterium xiamenense]MCD7060221.1 HlyU family transcriptional regulator [Pelagibacterium xiamenense]